MEKNVMWKNVAVELDYYFVVFSVDMYISYLNLVAHIRKHTTQNLDNDDIFGMNFLFVTETFEIQVREWERVCGRRNFNIIIHFISARILLRWTEMVMQNQWIVCRV